MTAPEVSAVVPVYNERRFLPVTLARERKILLVVPPLALCTDNAAMIAAAGWFAAKRKRFSPLTAPARADWKAGTPLEAAA